MLRCFDDYLDLLNGDKTFEINKYNLSTFMKLDSSTMKALNILPNGTQRAITSIFELFKCKTLGGSRLLSQWLKQPLIDLSLIEERQELVKAMIDDTSLRVEIRSSCQRCQTLIDCSKSVLVLNGRVLRTKLNKWSICTSWCCCFPI